MAHRWRGFYSTEQVSRLAGIPRRTLYLWKKNGVISPSVRVVDSNGRTQQGYSYADLAIAKVLHALKLRRLNLRSAVGALRHLYSRFGPPTAVGWADAHVFVVGKEVFAQKPDDWDTTLATKGGQKANISVLGQLVEEQGALLVPREFSDYVEIDPLVMDGEPVVRDTRVPTSMLAMLFNEGTSVLRLAELYAPIPASTIRKAIEFEKGIGKTSPNTATRTRTSSN
jgi:uncharacterized protein (DUF433 family)